MSKGGGNTITYNGGFHIHCFPSKSQICIGESETEILGRIKIGKGIKTYKNDKLAEDRILCYLHRDQFLRAQYLKIFAEGG